MKKQLLIFGGIFFLHSLSIYPIAGELCSLQLAMPKMEWHSFQLGNSSDQSFKAEKWYLAWDPTLFRFGEALWGRNVFDFSVQHLVETKGVFMSESLFDVPVDLRFDTKHMGLTTDIHVNFEKGMGNLYELTSGLGEKFLVDPLMSMVQTLKKP
jgi:hypothetical protein